MHLLTASRDRLEIEPISTRILDRQGRLLIHVESETASPYITDAARAFFEMDPQRGSVRARRLRAGPPPAVFRERDTGMLRMVYREAVIRFRDRVPSRTRRAILGRHGFRVRSVNAFSRNQCIVYDPSRRCCGVDLIEVANDWASMDEVRFATPNFVSEYRRDAARRIHPEQWHLRNRGRYEGQKIGEDVDARDAWKISAGKRSITVAVLDDGVDVDHPNLRRNIRKKPDPREPRDLLGRDFFIPDDDDPEHFNPRPKKFRFPFDRMAGNDIHGTPCAGVVAAAGVRSGAIGIAPGCRILAVKIFHADALASDARVADAIRYAAIHADVLSCSWSGGSSPDIELAIEDARLGRRGRGTAVFVAAGNEFGSPVAFPGNHPDAIAVGASTDRGTLARYSNVGPEIGVVAPSSGGIAEIFTTDLSLKGRGFNPGDPERGGRDGLHTNDFGGSSSATPLAAGVAALVLSVNPKLDREALREILTGSAEKIGRGYDAKGHSPKYGYGRVNAAKALKAARAAKVPRTGGKKKARRGRSS
jgi:subtilisin family serine protease